MSDDFYSRLFTYRARENREPLEDFLTELFRELLNTIAGSEHAEFIGELLKLQNLGCEWGKVAWRTQVTIDSGRCDLVGKSSEVAKSSVFIIVENKIGAGFTTGAGGDDQDQLIRYNKYLQSRFEAKKFLVLITLYSFHRHSFQPDATTISWRAIARQLGNKLIELGDDKSILTSQIRWFVNFMENNRMNEVKISLQDIASTASWKRLEASCSVIGGEVARQALVNESALEKHLNNCNLFRPMGYGDLGRPGKFSGVIFTPRVSSKSNYGVKADEADLVVWFGVLMDEAYGVPPTINNIPEFSAAIGLWVKKEKKDVAELIMAQIFKQLPDKPEWHSHVYPYNNDKDVYVIRKSKPLSIVYDESVDWVDWARSFYMSAAADLTLVGEDAWDSLAKFLV